MTWYAGVNRSGRLTPWGVGDLLRYDFGETALMRITSVREMGETPHGISCSIRYYGRAFHSNGKLGDNVACTGRYHGQCMEPTAADRELWARCHDPETDEWIRGAYGNPIHHLEAT